MGVFEEQWGLLLGMQWDGYGADFLFLAPVSGKISITHSKKQSMEGASSDQLLKQKIEWRELMDSSKSRNLSLLKEGLFFVYEVFSNLWRNYWWCLVWIEVIIKKSFIKSWQCIWKKECIVVLFHFNGAFDPWNEMNWMYKVAMLKDESIC